MCALVFGPGCAAIRGPQGAGTAGVAEQAQRISPRTLRASAVVEVKRIFSVKGRALIAARSPDKFRIEVLGPLNGTAALFVSDGDGLYIFSDGRSARYGWEDPGNPFPFRPEEVVSALLGSSPAGAGDYSFSTDTSGHITRLARKKNGEPALAAAMSDYRTVAGADIPFSITIEDEKKSLGIRYSSVEVNPELGTGFFDTSHLP